MNIHTAAKYLQYGYRIRRQKFPLIERFLSKRGDSLMNIPSLSLDELLADDWELVKERIINDNDWVEYEPEPDDEEL